VKDAAHKRTCERDDSDEVDNNKKMFEDLIK
jgi:hypothetical protein